MLEVSVAPSSSGLTSAVATMNLSGTSDAALKEAETLHADLGLKEESIRLRLKAMKVELSRCPLALEIQGLEQQLVQVGNQKSGQGALIRHYREQLGLPPVQEIGGDNDDISFMSQTEARPFHKENEVDDPPQVPSQYGVPHPPVSQPNGQPYASGDPKVFAYDLLSSVKTNVRYGASPKNVLKTIKKEGCVLVMKKLIEGGFQFNPNCQTEEFKTLAANPKYPDLVQSLTHAVLMRIIMAAWGFN